MRSESGGGLAAMGGAGGTFHDHMDYTGPGIVFQDGVIQVTWTLSRVVIQVTCALSGVVIQYTLHVK